MGGNEIILFLALLGFIGLFILSIFLIPLHIKTRGSFGSEGWAVAIGMNWGGVGIRVDSGAQWKTTILIGKTPVMKMCLPSDEKHIETEEAGAEESPRKPSLQEIREMSQVIPHLIHFLRVIFAHTGVEKFHLWFRAGFEDPVITGEVFGVVQALNGMLRPTPVHLEMEPLFSGGEPASEGEIILRVSRPVVLLVSAGKMILQPECRIAIQRITRGEG